MASVVCTTAAQLQQLAAIMDVNEARYGEVIPTTLTPDPPYFRLFQSYALAELHGAANYFAYVDPNGKQPFVIGMLTTLAALADKMIADSYEYEYMVQSVNTVQVLLNLRMTILYNSAISYASGLYNLAVGHANGLYNLAIGHADAISGQVNGRISAVQNALQANINALSAQANGRMGALYNASVAHTDAVSTQVNTRIGAVQNALQANINGVQGQLTQLVGTDVAKLAKDITDTANTAEQQVKNAVATAEAAAATLAATAGASAVTKVVAALQPQISAIKTETDQCLAPLCDSVTPNAKQLGKLGNLLHDLTDAALLGGVLALLVEAAHDPGRLVTDIENDLGGIVDGAAHGLRDLIGV